MYRRVSGIVRRWGHLASMALLIGALLGVLAGCGETDECANVSCDFGVCEAGQCQNPSSCEVDLDCLPGSVCGEEGVCKTVSSCAADTDCAAGVCVGGTCVNPDTCESNEDCLERTYCAEDNTCQPDPCNIFQCEVGQCARGTRECVSKDTCTLETEAQDCVDGEQCLDGSCYEEAAYCDALACERGVCDFQERACVNADSCEGDDANCTEGFYCNDSNECAEDLCLANNIECPNGGVCKPSVGQCHNPATCEQQSDCLEGHVCIGDQCLLEALACGDDGCPGNQLCDINEDARSASCIENTTEACTTSLDCRNNRQCTGNSCMQPFSCVDDRFEPNNADEAATDFNMFATAAYLDASICSGDTDIYDVDLSQYEGLPLRGNLIVKVTYATRDIGLGELELEVIDANGTTVDVDTSGEMGQDGQLEVVATLNAASPRQYRIKVSDAGSVGQPGVSYTLSADMFESGALSACDSAVELVEGTPATGNTAESEAYAFGSTCTSLHNNASDDIYYFELTEPTRVSLNILPRDTSKDFSISLRSSCEDIASEIACENLGTSGGELLRTVLGAGTYFVQVQTAQGAAAGGAYTLSMQTEARTCSPADNACINTTTAEMCNAEGTALVETNCSLGCAPSTGTCIKPRGDVCENPSFLAHGETAEFMWSDFDADHEMVFNECLNNTSGEQTKGPDAVYAVRVGPNEGLQAELELADGENGAIYIVENCASMRSTCIGGANENRGNTEVATYINDTGVSQTLLVVADSAAGSTGAASLSVDISPIICQPGEQRCDANNEHLEECNDIGTAYRPGDECRFGCNTGATSCDMSCNPSTDVTFCDDRTLLECTSSNEWQETQCGITCNGGGCDTGADTCADVVDVTSSASQSGGTLLYGTWGDFGSDLAGSGCGVTSSYTDGMDVVVSVTLNAGQTLSASLVSSGINADPSLIVSPTCGNASSSTCLAGDSVQDSTATVTYTASATETVFITANSDDTNSLAQGETFDFHVSIQ